MPFRLISPRDIELNTFGAIGDGWFLLDAGSPRRHNAMTCSWGQWGHLWNKDVVTVYVRPQRYTRQFMEAQPRFTVSLFKPGQKREALALMGSKSGRDGDKIAEAGLEVTELDGLPAFADARLVLCCTTLYRQDLQRQCFLNADTAEVNYPQEDLHRMYIGEIDKVFFAG